MFKNPVPTLQKTHYVPITNMNSMLQRAIKAVLMTKHCALKGWAKLCVTHVSVSYLTAAVSSCNQIYTSVLQ